MIYTRKTELFTRGLLFLVLVALFATTAQAQEEITATTSTTTPEKIETAPVQTQQTPVERTALTPQAQTRITNLSANISNRADAVIYRFTAIVARLEARIQIVESQGYDVREAQTHLNEAKVALGEAKNAIADIDTVVTAMVRSEKPQESWIAIRDIYKAVAFHLLDTKHLLQQVIADLKGAPLKTSSSNATTTEEIESEVN